ncbi:MAG: pyridine nucleotide-disulfide oxidoreductase [Nevskiaceae bacterium]|jgi:pyridine nucleotide-disulfide oxidoreductase family protein|nr:MAG: pyridine nucleotide-disulfide oxidoreductase [Nevskiaceae bacterium]
MSQPRLILVGGGHAHLLVLQALAARRPQGVDITLISRSRWQHYSGMLPGWMKQHYALDDCRIDLLPLLRQTRVHFIEDHIVGMDADQRCVCLSGGTHVHYDLLSLDVGSEVNTEWLTDLGPKLLPIKPLAIFSERWPAIVEQARASASWQLGVVGGGAAGVEAALAAAETLRHAGALASVSLITGQHGLLPGHASAVRRRVEQALRDGGIEVIQRRAVGTAQGVLLDDGQARCLDAVIAATGARAPVWLHLSKLQLDEHGFVAVNGHHQSTSHPNVFAAGDVCARIDRHVARSGVHAVRAGPVLAHNLLASLNGTPLRTYSPRRWSLYLLAIGGGQAVASWGPFSAAGAWVWRLKDRIDRRFMARFHERSST